MVISVDVVGNNIRYYRLKKGLSQSDLALLIGVSKNTISSFERSEFIPSLDHTLSLCHVFNCPVEKLFNIVYKVL